MNNSPHRPPLSWSARLLIGLLLVLAGAAAMTWSLAHYRPMARLLGVERSAATSATPRRVMQDPPRSPSTAAPAALAANPSNREIANVEQRVARVEALSEHAAGSAGRADALVVAFAARRAIDRGVALGYLENLLVQRFGARHQAAVATIITAARKPVRLSELVTAYEGLGPALRRGGPTESWWSSLSREMGSLVEVHGPEQPSGDSQVRFRRALQHLSLGDADRALAETMRMPGAANARSWIEQARRYVAAQRALDEIESAALLGDGGRGG